MRRNKISQPLLLSAVFLGSLFLLFAILSLNVLAGEPNNLPHPPDALTTPLTANDIHSNVIGPNETTICGSSHSTPTANEQTVVNLTNQLRAQNGVRPLVISPSLMKSADTHSLQMARTGVFAHDSYGATLARTQSCGSPATAIDENIAGNGSGDPNATFQQYVNSPEHKANLLDPSMVAVGVSFEQGIYNDGSTVWQNFWMNTMTFSNVADSGTSPNPTPTPNPTPAPTPNPTTPVASLSLPSQATVNQSVSIVVSGSGAAVPYYAVNYGDGSSSNWQTSQQFSHTYTSSNTYTVSGFLGDGSTGAISQPSQRSIVITSAQPTPTPTPQPQPSFICASALKASIITITPC